MDKHLGTEQWDAAESTNSTYYFKGWAREMVNEWTLKLMSIVYGTIHFHFLSCQAKGQVSYSCNRLHVH